ncbi:hypothetical protein TWF694_006382 [Orbilia ellipsospora]|uniref:Uncharacterized protein n=1 Tax=Orbilia ellipsospora TaxID=2528407 RepID=A0AAV9XLF4_9PEZI
MQLTQFLTVLAFAGAVVAAPNPSHTGSHTHTGTKTWTGTHSHHTGSHTGTRTWHHSGSMTTHTLTGKLPTVPPSGTIAPNPALQSQIVKPKKMVAIPGWTPGKSMFKGKDGKKTGHVVKPPPALSSIAANKAT